MVIQSKLTLGDFEAYLVEAERSDRLLELIHGEMVEKLPTEEHGLLATLLIGEIYIYLKKHPIGRVMVEVRHQAPGDPYNSRLPDIAFMSSERALPIVRSGAVPLMPDLVVEIKSPSDRYLEIREKALYYLRNGSRLVWLVFPDEHQMEVYTMDTLEILTLEDTLHGGEVLPGFALAVRAVFAVSSGTNTP